MYRQTDRPAGPSPQLAVRVAILGGIALVMFGVLFFRLWSLQILSGPRYRAEANDNRIRDITIQAPRGRVVDRNGTVLVDNRPGYAIEADPSKLPQAAAERKRLWARLAPLVRMRPDEISREVGRQLRALPFADATVKQDVPAPVYAYVLEHQERFPGVTVEQVFLRTYPHRDIGAQLFGTVGKITPQELHERAYRAVYCNDRVGQSGIEASYDRDLRGVDGADRVQVDALGNLRGELTARSPTAGRQLRLTLDNGVEQAGQDALAGAKGAFVAMNVRDGAILGLGSSPSFDPNALSKAISESDYRALTDPANGAPIVNRATQGLYPTGSTFKLITATAALESGAIAPDTILNDPGYFTIGGMTLKNDGGAVNGAIALPQAIKVSSDVFFYQLGAQLDSRRALPLQRWAHRLGLGQPTGIDLPAELGGLIPTPAWRDALYRKALKRSPQCVAIGTCRPWSVGDNINLAIGQGDVEVTPLQLAVAYAAIGNGGAVVRPHLGLDVESPDGRVLQELTPRVARRIPLAPAYRTAIMDGLHMAADTPGGTSYPVFRHFPIPLAGKTGTAQRGNGTDQSWYAALAPWPDPQYVVVVTFESGGYGVQTAAPAAEKILAALENVHLKPGQAQSAPPPPGINPYG